MKQFLLEQFRDWRNNFQCFKTDLGLTNDNYILDNKFLLRKSSPQTIFFIQRANEIAILELIKDKKINVPIVHHFFDKDSNFIYISRFFTGAKNFAQLPQNETNLKQVANLIKKLHQVDYQNSSIKRLDMKQNLINHIKLSGYANDDAELNNLIKKIKMFLKEFDWNGETVLSHNDPLKENFLIDSQNNWYLIDYEYCSLNTPYYDVAVFASASGLVKERKLWKFWLKLFNLEGKQEERKLLFFVLYRDVLGHFWARCMNLHGPKSTYQQLMAKKLQQAKVTFQFIEQL